MALNVIGTVYKEEVISVWNFYRDDCFILWDKETESFLIKCIQPEDDVPTFTMKYEGEGDKKLEEGVTPFSLWTQDSKAMAMCNYQIASIEPKDQNNCAYQWIMVPKNGGGVYIKPEADKTLCLHSVGDRLFIETCREDRKGMVFMYGTSNIRDIFTALKKAVQLYRDDPDKVERVMRTLFDPQALEELERRFKDPYSSRRMQMEMLNLCLHLKNRGCGRKAKMYASSPLHTGPWGAKPPSREVGREEQPQRHWGPEQADLGPSPAGFSRTGEDGRRRDAYASESRRGEDPRFASDPYATPSRTRMHRAENGHSGRHPSRYDLPDEESDRGSYPGPRPRAPVDSARRRSRAYTRTRHRRNREDSRNREGHREDSRSREGQREDSRSREDNGKERVKNTATHPFDESSSHENYPDAGRTKTSRSRRRPDAVNNAPPAGTMRNGAHTRPGTGHRKRDRYSGRSQDSHLAARRHERDECSNRPTAELDKKLHKVETRIDSLGAEENEDQATNCLSNGRECDPAQHKGLNAALARIGSNFSLDKAEYRSYLLDKLQDYGYAQKKAGFAPPGLSIGDIVKGLCSQKEDSDDSRCIQSLRAHLEHSLQKKYPAAMKGEEKKQGDLEHMLSELRNRV